MYESLSCGIKLTIANIMSLLILGIGRISIDNVWGIESFGKISLSLSLANFFLVFIQQISMVLFPALRRIDEERIKSIYRLLRNFLGLILPTIYILYFPIKIIIGMWLPQYSLSLKYLGLLLPLCIFDGKMQLLCNTYLKVLRKEGKLLQFNLVAFIVSLISCSISAYCFNNITLVVLCMVSSIAIRSIMAEIYLSKQINFTIKKILSCEAFLGIIFMTCAWNMSEFSAIIIILICYIIYLIVNWNTLNIDELIKKMRSIL